MRGRIYLVLGLLLWTSAEAQTHTPNATKGPPSAPLPMFEITLSKEPDYQVLPWAWTTQPEVVETDCAGDGNVYVSVGGGNYAPVGLAALAPKGIVTFLNKKITDVPHPFYKFGAVNPSIWGSGVAFEVQGMDDAKVEITTWIDEEGRVQAEEDATNAVAGNYIARFDKDGTYKGAIAIDDLPFQIYKFATFDSGNIIAQGRLEGNQVARIALLDSSAKFLRYLDLPKDISMSQDVVGDDLMCTGCTAMADEVVSFSYFTPWQGKVLLWRRYTSIPRIYEIQESGQARVVNIKAPEGYDIGSPIRTDRNWFVSFNKPDAKGNRPETFDSLLEVNPQTGKPLGEYRMKPPDKMPETVISCFFDGEFWGVRQDTKGQKLEVVRGTAAPYRGK